MVFFCFKQKTAYDLRISDWSSDVFSSDLVVDLDASRHIQMGDEAHVRLVDAHSESDGRHGDDRLLLDEAVLVRRPFGCIQAGVVSNRGEKIGRAACRERVCQYV